MTNRLRDAINRGRPKEVIRRLLVAEAQAALAGPPALPGPDRGLAARLVAAGWRPGAPSARALVAALGRHEGRPCPRCRSSRTWGTGYVRRGDALLVIECPRCGHQEAAPYSGEST